MKIYNVNTDNNIQWVLANVKEENPPAGARVPRVTYPIFIPPAGARVPRVTYPIFILRRECLSETNFNNSKNIHHSFTRAVLTNFGKWFGISADTALSVE